MKSFVTPNGTHALLQFIEANQDKRLLWEVKPYKKPRTLGMNAYHFSQVITPLANYIGESPEETHRNLCGLYWGWVEKDLGGGLVLRKPRRTTTTNEHGERDVVPWEVMSDFIEFCKAKAAEIGCPLSEAA